MLNLYNWIIVGFTIITINYMYIHLSGLKCESLNYVSYAHHIFVYWVLLFYTGLIYTYH